MGDCILVATRKGLFAVRKSPGRGWQPGPPSFLGDNVTIALADSRDGTWYACLTHGHFGTKVHRSSDQGETWEECATPTFPPQPEGEEDVNPWTGKPLPWKLDRVWALEAGHADEPGVLWCGTIPGGLFRSADRGSSWELVRPLWDNPLRKQWFGGGADLPGIHSICVHPADGKKILLGVSCGGIWGTADGGESWELRADGMRAAYMPPEKQYEPNAQDPHCLVRCPGSPEHLWVQHHNGIFRSTNEAANWEEIQDVSPSGFGFAVAVHPTDPETAWFVPGMSDERRIPVSGQVVVNRTRDGGRTFETLRNGLPQENAYDLVFRHALAIDSTGDRLAFGSTTGSLWATEDGGDSWTHVGAHLPPVYSVRFA